MYLHPDSGERLFETSINSEGQTELRKRLLSNQESNFDFANFQVFVCEKSHLNRNKMVEELLVLE